MAYIHLVNFCTEARRVPGVAYSAPVFGIQSIHEVEL